MKLLLYTILFALLLPVLAFSQSEYDALKFSQFLPSGTSRYTALGGAFSALGADMSTMATNPAGTALYRKSEMGMSTAWTNHTVTSNYYSDKKEANNLSFQLTNMGFVTVNKGSENSDWKSTNLGFAYNHLNDYNKNFSVAGQNNVSSLLDKQVQMLNGSPSDTLQNAYYKANLIFMDGGNFYNDYNYNGNYYGSELVHKVSSSGYAGEYDLNISSNYQDRLYLGATLGFQKINYSNHTLHSEKANNTEIALADFQSDDYLNAKGSGFNLKVGVLYKLNQMIRLGAAIHTPTLYSMKYEYWTDVSSNLNFGTGVENYIGKSPRGSYNWNFVSPARIILSSAVVLGQKGIVSGELEYMDYSQMSLNASDYFFESENENIDKIYSGAVNAKLGAEIKVWLVSLRAGVAYFDSPYKSSETNADAYKLALSGGLGFNAGHVYFDTGYQVVTGDEMYYMYGYEDSGVSLSNKSSKFITTLGFRF